MDIPLVDFEDVSGGGEEGCDPLRYQHPACISSFYYVLVLWCSLCVHICVTDDVWLVGAFIVAVSLTPMSHGYWVARSGSATSAARTTSLLPGEPLLRYCTAV